MKFFAILCCVIFCVCVVDILADSGNLQDTCPTAPGKQAVFINGYPCKNPGEINAQDFKSTKLTRAGDTDNFFQSNVTLVTAAEFPGLNTLGLSVSRTDLEVDGIVPPHSHPRSSEMLFVYRGVLIAGFIDTKNQIFQKVLKKGDVFVFPKGLLHFCLNSGFESATAFSFHNSQNPGVVSIRGVLGLGVGIDQEGIKNLTRQLVSVSASTTVAGDPYNDEL